MSIISQRPQNRQNQNGRQALNKWINYKQRYLLTNREPQIRVIFDREGNPWIYRLNPQRDSSGNVNIKVPDFIYGVAPIQGLIQEDRATGNKYILNGKIFPPLSPAAEQGHQSVQDEDLQNDIRGTEGTKGIRIYNYIDMGLSQFGQFNTFIVDFNNIPLVGQLKGLFIGLKADTVIIKNLNTDKIESIENLFLGQQIFELHFENCRIGTIENAYKAFSEMKLLKKLDIRCFQFCKTVNLQQAFMNSADLREIILPELRLKNGASLTRLFQGCRGLRVVNSEQIKIQGKQHINVRFMFEDTIQLRKLDLRNVDIHGIVAKGDMASDSLKWTLPDSDTVKQVKFDEIHIKYGDKQFSSTPQIKLNYLEIYCLIKNMREGGIGFNTGKQIKQYECISILIGLLGSEILKSADTIYIY